MQPAYDPDTPRAITVSKIHISSGARTCYIGPGLKFGLGAVGEEIRPYLDHRHTLESGVLLFLPDDVRKIRVYEILWRATPNADGKHPVIRRPLSALEAADLQLPAAEEAAK
ncbi:hypothetical protein [Flexivirga sp. B27]